MAKIPDSPLFRVGPRDQSLVRDLGCDLKDETNGQEITSNIESPVQLNNDIPYIAPKEDDKLRSYIRKVMGKPVVENMFLIFIIMNSIMMGIGTYDFITEDEHANTAFYYCDLVFLSIFTVELSLTVFHRRYDVLTDAWVMFDFLIISVSWILSAKVNFDPLGEGTKGVQVIRSLRIFRVISKIESLKIVLNAVGNSLPRLGCLAIFSFIIMFIFAIFFTEQYREMYENGQTDVDYFSRLDYTYLTLYQLLTLDAWIDVLRNVMETYPNAWIPFLIYVNFQAFIIINLAIAVICESIFELNTSKDEERKMMRDAKNAEYLMLIQSTCFEIYDQLDLPRPLPAVNPVASGDELSINRTQSNMSIDQEKSRVACQSVLDETESKNYPSVTSSCAKTRKLCGNIVNHQYVQVFVVLVILVNSILLAVGTFDFVVDNLSTKSAFDITSDVFLIIYTVENAMQLIYHGPHRMFKDGWLTFDFILIVLSWALSLSPAFRVLRVVRLIHVLPKFEAMRTITGTLLAAIPKISAISGILMVFFYVFAVMFTTLFKDIPVGVENGLSIDYFSRLDKTLLTLFQLMTMVNWASISRELAEHVRWAPFLTSFFLSVSGLLFVNAIVALICEAHENVGNKIKELQESEVNCGDNSFDYQVLNIKTMHNDILHLLKIRETPVRK